jgi:hypothetical protein
MGYVGGVLVYDEIRGVEIVTLSQLSDALFPNKKSYEVDYVNELMPAVKEWVANNRAHLYVDFEEDFSVFKGVRQAIDKGLSVVVVDSLS